MLANSQGILMMSSGIPFSFASRSCHTTTRDAEFPLSLLLRISRIHTKPVASGSVDPSCHGHHFYSSPVEIKVHSFVSGVAKMCANLNNPERRPEIGYEFRRWPIIKLVRIVNLSIVLRPQGAEPRKSKSKSKESIYLDMLVLAIFQLNGMVLLFSIDWGCQ